MRLLAAQILCRILALAARFFLRNNKLDASIGVAWGASGRRFKSSRPDQINQWVTAKNAVTHFYWGVHKGVPKTGVLIISEKHEDVVIENNNVDLQAKIVLNKYLNNPCPSKTP